MSEKAVKIAAALYDARDAMRHLLGDRYRERCELWVHAINRTMQRRGCDVLYLDWLNGQAWLNADTRPAVELLCKQYERQIDRAMEAKR